MSHDITESSAINSGAINHVSFPGAEAGVSLIQLVGNVSALGNVTGVILRLTASATVSAKAATSSPTLKFISSLSATTISAATGTVSKFIKLTAGATTSGNAVGVATGLLRISLAASRTAQAIAATPVITTRGLRSAVASGKAVVSVSSSKKFYRTAATLASASVSVTALRTLRFAAQTNGEVDSLVSVIRRFRLAISVAPSAIAPPFAIISKIPAGASVAAAAIDSVTPYIALRFVASGLARAVCAAAASGARASRSATDAAFAVTSATPVLRMPIGAATIATFSGFTVALDYSITSAPRDRQMVVPLEERRMEVAPS